MKQDLLDGQVRLVSNRHPTFARVGDTRLPVFIGHDRKFSGVRDGSDHSLDTGGWRFRHDTNAAEQICLLVANFHQAEVQTAGSGDCN